MRGAPVLRSARFWVGILVGVVTGILLVGELQSVRAGATRPHLVSEVAEEQGLDVAAVDQLASEAATTTPGISPHDLEAVHAEYGSDRRAFVNEYTSRCMASVGLTMSWTPLAELFEDSPMSATGLALQLSPRNPDLLERQQRGIAAFSPSAPALTEKEQIREDLSGPRANELLQRSTPEWAAVNATCMDLAQESADELEVPVRPLSELTRAELVSAIRLTFDYGSWLGTEVAMDPGLEGSVVEYDTCMGEKGFPDARIGFPRDLASSEADRSVDAALADFDCGFELRSELHRRLARTVAKWFTEPASYGEALERSLIAKQADE